MLTQGLTLRFRRRRQGKLNLFSRKMKKISFVVHATPLQERPEDTKTSERLEMKSYRKNRGILCRYNIEIQLLYIIVVGAVVSVDSFSNYVKDMHNDRDEKFEEEYSVSTSALQCTAHDQ